MLISREFENNNQPESEVTVHATLSVEGKDWSQARCRLPGSLSLVMLFGDLGRWRDNAKARFKEMREAGIFSEAVLIVNRQDEDVVAEVKADLADFDGFPTLILFHRDNNIPAGRNAGISQARGEYVMIWDDDDSVQPELLQIAFRRVFLERSLPILELPLSHPDGRPFHPQPAELMPQVPLADNLLVMGMVHTPFITRRELMLQIPIPEHVALRGDWLHWSAMLWRQGVPIVSLTGSLAKESDRTREIGATASIEVNDFARFHAFVSLLFLFYQYSIDCLSPECALIRRRYFNRYCSEHQDEMWSLLVQLAKLPGDFDRLLGEAESLGHCGRILANAAIHVRDYVRQVDGIPVAGVAKFDVFPFEIFSPKRRGELNRAIESLKKPSA